MLVDADGRIRQLNPAAELLTGHSANHATDKTFVELGPEFGELEDLVKRCLAEAQAFGLSFELAPLQADRPPQLIMCRVTPIASGAGMQVLVEMLDASHSRQLDREKALISQRGASRRIIRQLAHEIRNPLGGLRGAAQLLDRELDNPELQEYTQVIMGEADRLVALTDSLLGPTRQSCMGPVNIHEVTERVLLLLAGEVQAGVELLRDYDPSLPMIKGDQDQLLQAVLNVARNAVQALQGTGQVIIRTRALAGFVIGSERHRLVVTIDIEDNGPGIQPELADSIFYPLVSGRHGGTGLGLPLAQDLISRHRGLIEFESEPGRTVFMLRIPLET